MSTCSRLAFTGLFLFFGWLIASLGHGPIAWADLLDEEVDAPVATPSPQASPSAAPSAPEGAAQDRSGSRPRPKPTPDFLSDDESDEQPAAGATPDAQKEPKPQGHSSRASASGGKKSGADQSKLPVHVRSQGARALREKGEIELIDDVHIMQGNMRMESDRAHVFYDEAVKDVAKAVATGDVKFFSIDANTGEEVKAFGHKATFDNKSRTVTMEGDVRFWRGANLAKSKKIIYELDTGWVRGDRVQGVMYPEASKSNSGPGKQQGKQ